MGASSPRGRSVSFPYLELFVGLLVAYMVYSVWAHLDARYPIAAALVLLLVTAIVYAGGASASANVLAEYVFFLLGAGIVLLLVEQFRASRRPAPADSRPPQGEAPEASEPGQRSADEPLDRVQ